MATTKKIFVVKCKKPSRNPEGKPFWAEVGRIVLHEGADKTTGTLYMNHLVTEYAVFQADPKTAAAGDGAEEARAEA